MPRIRRNEGFWRECIERWTASGLSAGQFAAREGLRRERLFYWKRRLHEAGTVAVSDVKFARAEIRASSTPQTGAPLEVVTTSGHMVRVPAGFDEDVLRRLLTILGGA